MKRRILRIVKGFNTYVQTWWLAGADLFIREAQSCRVKRLTQSQDNGGVTKGSSSKPDLAVRGSLTFDWVKVHTVLGLNQVLAPKVKSSFKKTFLDPEKAFRS